MKTFYTLIISLLILPAIKICAQSQGPNNPGTVTEAAFGCLSCQGTDWMNFNNVKLPDGNFASTQLFPYPNCFMSSCFMARALEGENFGFTIPGNATIVGIKVDVKRKAGSANAIRDTSVQLLRQGIPVGNDYYNPAFWDTTNMYVSYGGATDLWGIAWTPSLIDSTNFGVYFKPANFTNTSQDAYVDHIRITVFYTLPTAPPVAFFTTNDTVICAGDTVHFTDQSTGAPTSWSWTFQGGNPISSALPDNTVTYTTAGTFDVTLRVANGIGSDSLLKTGYIHVLPGPVLTTNGDTAICTGDTIQIGVSGGISYQWSPCVGISSCSDSVVFAAPTMTRVYHIIATGANGCTSADSLVLTVNPLPTQPTITISGDTLISSYSNGNQWFKNDTLISGATGQRYIVTQTGYYSVEETNTFGCRSISDTAHLIITEINSLTNDEQGIHILPNPSNGNFIVQFIATANIPIATFQIFDDLGKMVMAKNISLNSGGTNYSIRLQKEISRGVYFIELTTESGIFRKKVLITQ